MLTEIYVRLLDESVDVWKPVTARHLTANVYRIVGPKADESETWQFTSGEVVTCESVESADGPILAAVRRAATNDA